MLMLLSPAKSLDFDTPAPELPATRPHFVAQAQQLVALLRQKSPQQLAGLMAISDKLALLNVGRYAAWSPHFSAANAKPALLAFDGTVYQGLDARSLGLADLHWAQQHLVILSGLYGVLRPLDWLQAYRLEMGTRLPNARGPDLYAFWRSDIAVYLRQLLQQQHRGDDAPVLLNLASQEYFKSVDTQAVRARVVACVFQDYRAGQYKIIAFMAKRARGLMARWVIQQRAEAPAQLLDFAEAGYRYTPAASQPDTLVFRRQPA